MKINGTKLNNFKSNFLKELMGDPGMSDARAEIIVNKLAAKYDVDFLEVTAVAAKRWEVKNAEFKRLEAEELAKG